MFRITFLFACNIADRALKSTNRLQQLPTCSERLKLHCLLCLVEFEQYLSHFGVIVHLAVSHILFWAALAKFLLAPFVCLCACLFGCFFGCLYRPPQALAVWISIKVTEKARWARARQRARVRWSPASEQATLAVCALDRPKPVTC